MIMDYFSIFLHCRSPGYSGCTDVRCVCIQKTWTHEHVAIRHEIKGDCASSSRRSNGHWGWLIHTREARNRGMNQNPSIPSVFRPTLYFL